MQLTPGRAWWQSLLLRNPSRQLPVLPFLFIFAVVCCLCYRLSLLKSPEAWEMEYMLASVSSQVRSHWIHVYSSVHSARQNSFFHAPCTFSAPAKAVFAMCFLCMVDNAVQCALVWCFGSWHSAQPLQVSGMWCVFVDSPVTLMCHNQAGLYEEVDAVRGMHQGCGTVTTKWFLVFRGLKIES